MLKRARAGKEKEEGKEGEKGGEGGGRGSPSQGGKTQTRGQCLLPL